MAIRCMITINRVVEHVMFDFYKSFQATAKFTIGRVTRRGAILGALATLLLLGNPCLAAESPKVKDAMLVLKSETSKLGKPKLDGENLFFGTTKANGDYAIVDEIKTKFSGTATLFAKKGNNFVRVTTNVIKDGQRAVGTILDPSGPAVAAIRQGTSFYGMVDILGKIYDTGYEPIKADNGDIIGIYYVGFLME
jgi:Cache 3/Cache 2 fusion domain